MALFKRAKPRHFGAKLKEAVWPGMGWGRTVSYYRHRVFRTGDSDYSITAGLASGVAISFSPYFGTHFFQAIFLAWILRANMVAGFVGTAFGNPWTFPFIYWAGWKIGVAMCAFFGGGDFIALPEGMGFGTDAKEFLKYAFENPLKFLLPMTVGGYTAALLSFPVAYGALYYPVRLMRAAYHARREKRKAA